MPRRRFRWTRAAYRKAQHLARLLARFSPYELPDQPQLLRRFSELWERHPQRDDPLLTPVRQRLNCWGDDDIPF